MHLNFDPSEGVMSSGKILPISPRRLEKTILNLHLSSIPFSLLIPLTLVKVSSIKESDLSEINLNCPAD